MYSIKEGEGMSPEMQAALYKAVEEQGLDSDKIPMLTLQRNGQQEMIPMCLLTGSVAREIGDSRTAAGQLKDSFEAHHRRLLADISQLNSTLLLQTNMTRQLMQQNRGIVQSMTLSKSSQEKDLDKMSGEWAQLITQIMIHIKSHPKPPKSDVWKTLYM